jgi:hypothetical protein
MVDNDIEALEKYLDTPCHRVPFKNVWEWRHGKLISKENPDPDHYAAIPRGENLDFITAYLFVHGPSRASDIRRAMCKRIEVEYDRGKYSDYFYRVNGCRRRYGQLYEGGSHGGAFGRNPVNCTSPLWTQLCKRGPWVFTPKGAKRVVELLKRCTNRV